MMSIESWLMAFDRWVDASVYSRRVAVMVVGSIVCYSAAHDLYGSAFEHPVVLVNYCVQI